MLIIGFILSAALTNTDGLDYVQPTTSSLALRLLCCYLFHLSNYGDVADSFRRLKYLMRNPDKISEEHIPAAFLITQYQFWASFCCEAVNILFLTRQQTLIDLIMNYVAFEGISAMDNLYVESTRNLKVMEAVPVDGVEDAKKDALYTFTKEREDFTFEKPIGSDNKHLIRFMKFVRIWFVFVKYLYKGIYFYLFPYLIIPLSYIVFNYTMINTKGE